jgi:ribose transport system permease protein
VLGGCSLRGGEGGIFGVVIGTAVMQLLKNLIVLKHINQTLEFVIIGFVLLIGVTADELIRRLVAYRRSVQQARRLVKQQPPQDADTS